MFRLAPTAHPLPSKQETLTQCGFNVRSVFFFSVCWEGNMCHYEPSFNSNNTISCSCITMVNYCIRKKKSVLSYPMGKCTTNSETNLRGVLPSSPSSSSSPLRSSAKIYPLTLKPPAPNIFVFQIFYKHIASAFKHA